jgi:hypothetical protein
MKDYNNDGDNDNDDDMMDETNIFYPSSHSSDINGNNYDDGREEEQKLFNDFYQVGYDVEEYTAAEHDDHDHGNDDRYYRHRYDYVRRIYCTLCVSCTFPVSRCRST